MKNQTRHHVNMALPIKNIHQLWLWGSSSGRRGGGTESLRLLGDVGSEEYDILSDSRRVIRQQMQVPKGFLAVYVGPELRRFVIPTKCLSMPEFRDLMDRVAEEFGFERQGALRFPCDEHHFEQLLLRCNCECNGF